MGDSVFKNKNYMLMFWGLVVSNLGTQIYNFAIMLYIYDLLDGYKFSAAIAGAYMATGGVVFFILTPFAGAITDRLNKVRIAYMTDLINGVAVVIAGMSIFMFDDVVVKLVILFITSIVLSINGALFNPAIASLPVHILKKDQYQQASSLTMGMYSLYAIIGAFIGTLFYTNFLIQFIFIFNGLTFIASGISEMFITVKTKEDEFDKINFKQILIDVKEGVKYLVNLKPIFYLLAMASVLNFFTVPVIANGLPYLIYVDLNEHPVYLAILQGTFPVGVVIMTIRLMMKPQAEKQSPLIISGMVGMATLFIIFVGVLYLFRIEYLSYMMFVIITIPLMTTMGLYNAELNVPFDVAVKKTVEPEKMGRVVSVMSVISNGLSPIAIALAGVVISFFGVDVLFYAGGIAMALTAIYTAKNKYIAQL